MRAAESWELEESNNPADSIEKQMADVMKEKATDPLLAKLGEQLEKNPPEMTGTERIIAGIGEDLNCVFACRLILL